MRTFAVVNPAAGGGRVRRVWPRLLSRLLEASPSLSVRWTRGPGSATILTRDALKDGYERILAIGGDGTLNEVVNGFFEDQRSLNSSAVLAHIALGSGSDFRRTLGMPEGIESVSRLRSERIHPLDLLQIRYTTESGTTAHRLAVNVASFGLSGTVVQNLSGRRSLLPTRLRYLSAAVRTLFTETASSVRLTLDGETFSLRSLRLGAVANGHSFAAGLPIAPRATPSDGRFDVTLLHVAPKWVFLRHIARFYRGTHGTLDNVSMHRGSHLEARPEGDQPPVWVEADGEFLGRLPATFSIKKQAVQIQY